MAEGIGVVITKPSPQSNEKIAGRNEKACVSKEAYNSTGSVRRNGQKFKGIATKY